MKYLLLFCVIFGALAMTSVQPVWAQETTTVSADAAATDALATARLSNPLRTDDVRVIIGRIIKAILGISGGLALLMFIWGGLIWMTSQGNKDKIEKGQKTLAWSVIGLAILFVAYAAVNWVIIALQQSTG